MHDAASVYRPGDPVPASGIYQVRHYAHRLPHSALLLKDESFSACNECGGRVRFELLQAAEPLSQDRDFRVRLRSRAARRRL